MILFQICFKMIKISNHFDISIIYLSISDLFKKKLSFWKWHFLKMIYKFLNCSADKKEPTCQLIMIDVYWELVK